MAKLTPAQARKKHADSFAKFWSAYPRHTHYVEAQNAWADLMESGGDPVRIVGAARVFAAAQVDTDMKYVPGPHSWLKNGRYDDADLFSDQQAAIGSWMREMWRQVNVKAVENRFHISMPKQYPPDDITDPDAIRFWYQQSARAWIAQVHKEKVEKCSAESSAAESVPAADAEMLF